MINEFASRTADDESSGEYVELRNITGFPVNLYHATHTSNTWKLDRAVEFSFPRNTTIAAKRNPYCLMYLRMHIIVSASVTPLLGVEEGWGVELPIWCGVTG